MQNFSPHQTPEIKELVEQVHQVFDQHSATSVALFVGYTNNRTIPELARQLADQSGRKGHVNKVKEEIERRIRSLQEDLENALIAETE